MSIVHFHSLPRKKGRNNTEERKERMETFAMDQLDLDLLNLAGGKERKERGKPVFSS